MIEQLKRQVSALEAEHRILKREITDLKSRIQTLDSRLTLTEKAQSVLKQTAIETQNQLSYELSSIASLALESVFPDPYQFQIQFIEKRNRTEIDFSLTRDALVADDPLNSVGGGVCDLLSFSLRISCILISGSSRILLLDEPFKNLSRDLHPVAGALLKQISEKLAIQFLIVSHDKSLIEMLDATVVSL